MKSYDIESQLRQLVFQRTREYLAGRGNMTRLAAKAGVANSTLTKLAYGETRYPRFHTIVAVCDALGIKIAIVDNTASIAPVPISGEQKATTYIRDWSQVKR